MPGQTVTLSMIEAILATKRNSLAFPQPVETLYHNQMRSYRRKMMASGILPTIVIYNAFLIADFLLLPATFWLAVALHLFIVTPIIAMAGYLYPRLEQRWLQEMASTTIPLSIVVQILVIYALNRTVAANDYQYLAVPIVIFMNVNQRFGFRLAVVSTALIVATYLGVLLLGPAPFHVKFTGTCLMVSASYLSLIANLIMDRDQRFGFLRRLRDELRRQGAEDIAKRDALTGLANRRGLEEVADMLWSTSDQHDEPVAVIMIDIDHFKRFNDRYGHMVGDSCLKRVAAAIGDELRSKSDLAVRMGGEEFLMLLPQTDLGDAIRVAERVRRGIEGLAIPHGNLGPHRVVTASLGVMAGPVSAHSLSELTGGADAALYAAKRNGRDQVWPPLIKKDNAVVELRRAVRERRRGAP